MSIESSITPDAAAHAAAYATQTARTAHETEPAPRQTPTNGPAAVSANFSGFDYKIEPASGEVLLQYRDVETGKLVVQIPSQAAVAYQQFIAAGRPDNESGDSNGSATNGGSSQASAGGKVNALIGSGAIGSGPGARGAGQGSGPQPTQPAAAAPVFA